MACYRSYCAQVSFHSCSLNIYKMYEKDFFFINHTNVLADEGECRREDEKHAVAEHGECDGKVGSKAAPKEKLVHCSPVIGVQSHLEEVVQFILCCTHSFTIYALRVDRYLYKAAASMYDAAFTHLCVHHDQQTGLCQQGKGLIVGDVFAVVSDRVVHGGPWDEEEDEGAVAAVQHADHKGLLTEIHVQLARSVELRILETPAVIHILQKQTDKQQTVAFDLDFCSLFTPMSHFCTVYLIKEAQAEHG